MKKLTLTVLTLSLIVFQGCKPKASDVMDETCACLESITLRKNFSIKDYKKTEDSCIAVQREKYGKYIDEDRTFRKDLKAQEFKVDDSKKKIEVAFKAQTFEVSVYDLVKNYQENRFDYSNQMKDVNVITEGWISEKSENFIGIVGVKEIDGKNHVLTINWNKSSEWISEDPVGIAAIYLKNGNSLSDVLNIEQHLYKQKATIKGKIKKFKDDSGSILGVRYEKYLIVIEDAEIIKIEEIK